MPPGPPGRPRDGEIVIPWVFLWEGETMIDHDFASLAKNVLTAAVIVAMVVLGCDKRRR